MEKIKNIVIINDFDFVQGGASKVAIDTANLIANNYSDINVYFFCAVHNEKSELDSKVNRICTYQMECLKDKNKFRGIINGLYNFKAKRKLKKFLIKLKKDETILHVHGWTKALSSSVFSIIFKKDYKCVLTLHDYFSACPNGGFFNYQCNKICKLKGGSIKCISTNCDSRNYAFKLYRLMRFFIQNNIIKFNKKINNIVYISNFQWNILKDNFNKNINSRLISNPIDFDKKVVNKNFSNNEYYLCVSRLSPEKDVETFCEAIRKTSKKGIVVGDGSEIEKLIKKYPEIEFAGWKNSDEVKQYMKKAKYLVFTSKWYEGSPLTTMEALSMNLPCIVWAGCAASEQIEEGVTGFKYNTLEELCDIILKKQITKMNYIYENKYLMELFEFYYNI